MEAFFRALLECSVGMSVVSLAYMAATPLLSKRYAATWLYYTWLAIVIGWLCPFRPHWEAALFSLKPDMPAVLVEPIEAGKRLMPMVVGQETGWGSPEALWQVAAGLWLIGMIVQLALHARRHWRFMRLVNRWSEEVTDPETADVFRAVKTEMKVGGQIHIRICQGITTPMLVGFFRPVILLPPVPFRSDELDFILRHELVHFKRNDLWYKAVVLLAAAVHWFNPVVYLMAKAIAAQGEIACDERVLAGMSLAQRKRYGETIIGVVRSRDGRQTSFSTNFYEGKKGMRTRLFSIMDTTKKKSGLVILGIVLIATIGTGGAFAVSSAGKPVESSIAPAVGPSTAEAGPTQSSEGAAREGGGISTSNGKDLTVWLAAEHENNFGQAAWAKGETVTWSVACEQVRELEIGIMSVSTEKVYSKRVATGTGTITITVPEDGDYRIYVKNHAKEVAKFLLKLDKDFGPLV
ncbi:M56 family metallopeptidase [Brevibacillus sp. B_LB10_24]|uniref:M56 family metallopeptidase n=1 Tax=Brevibacillus sp. B_LB10_24 TaxID=3380645 RepID=UPI0038BBFD84